MQCKQIKIIFKVSFNSPERNIGLKIQFSEIADGESNVWEIFVAADKEK